MDKNFYHQKLAQEHQREISQELAARSLLKGIGHEPLSRKQARRLIVRVAFAVIVLSAIVAYLF